MKRLVLIVSLLLVSPAIAGTNVGNYNDGKNASKAFCRAAITKAWYMASPRDPTPRTLSGSYLLIRVKVGGIYEDVYGLNTYESKAFYEGWHAGEKWCFENEWF